MPKVKEPKWLQKIHVPPWLVLVLAITFLIRIPSFFEPYSYGDEMIYLNLGEAIKRGMVLYRDIHDNKPPLLYFTAALAGNVFWFRAILAAWMAATTVLFWKLSRTLFPNLPAQAGSFKKENPNPLNPPYQGDRIFSPLTRGGREGLKFFCFVFRRRFNQIFFQFFS